MIEGKFTSTMQIMAPLMNFFKEVFQCKIEEQTCYEKSSAEKRWTKNLQNSSMKLNLETILAM